MRSHPNDETYAKLIAAAAIGQKGSAEVGSHDGQRFLIPELTVTQTRIKPDAHKYRERFTTTRGSKGYRYTILTSARRPASTAFTVAPLSDSYVLIGITT